LPQRQRRRRRRGPSEYTAARRAKPPFPLNLLFNVKAFYMFFIVVMIASIAAVGLANPGAGRSTPPEIDDEVLIEATPSTVLSFDAPARTIDATQPHIATIKTDKGDIGIEFVTDAPETVNSFAFLAGSGFYNGTTFFYVDPKYWAQAGDPTCKADADTVCSGSGGPGYSLKLENTQEGHDQWAVVAPTLGQGGEDIHGSQFRILYEADPRLNGEETVFGKVVQGQEIMEQLGQLQPCQVVSAQNCDTDLSSALVIQEVIVEPKPAQQVSLGN
jgi:cyclophilin family peptidyl-prolyl cis-trans isomerase